MITKELGNRIKDLRNQIGISQEKFARSIGMDRIVCRLINRRFHNDKI